MIKLFKTKKIGNKAISEVFGTLLILGISVTFFSIIYASILSIQVNPATPSIDLVGSVEDNYLIINNLGGKPLDLDTKVIVTQDNGNINLQVTQGWIE